MKQKYQIQVAASLTKWYDIEAADEDEAKALAEKRMKAEVVTEQTAVGGSWDLVEKVVEQVLPANDEKDGEEHPDYNFYEVDFEDTTSICIRSMRKPTIEEANRWLAEDVAMFGKVTYVSDEISREEAEDSYDLSNERNLPVYGADEKK